MPENTQGVIPHLIVDDAVAAIEFYKKGFGATEVMRMPAQDGKRLMHAELVINGARIFIVDDFPEHRATCGDGKHSTPKSLGGSPVTMHLEVSDCDAAVKRVGDAGANVIMPPWDAFWGARYAQVRDPFGHAWSFAHPLPVKQS